MPINEKLKTVRAGNDDSLFRGTIKTTQKADPLIRAEELLGPNQPRSGPLAG